MAKFFSFDSEVTNTSDFSEVLCGLGFLIAKMGRTGPTS